MASEAAMVQNIEAANPDATPEAYLKQIGATDEPY